MIRLRLALWVLGLTVRLDWWASVVFGSYVARYCGEHGGHVWVLDHTWCFGEEVWQMCRVCRMIRRAP